MRFPKVTPIKTNRYLLDQVVVKRPARLWIGNWRCHSQPGSYIYVPDRQTRACDQRCRRLVSITPDLWSQATFMLDGYARARTSRSRGDKHAQVVVSPVHRRHLIRPFACRKGNTERKWLIRELKPCPASRGMTRWYHEVRANGELDRMLRPHVKQDNSVVSMQHTTAFALDPLQTKRRPWSWQGHCTCSR